MASTADIDARTYAGFYNRFKDNGHTQVSLCVQNFAHVSFQACRSLFLHKGLVWYVSFVVHRPLLWYTGLFASGRVFFDMGPFPMRRKNSSILQFRSLLWYTRHFWGIHVSFVVYTSCLRISGLFSSDHVCFERRPSPMRRKNSSVSVVI